MPTASITAHKLKTGWLCEQDYKTIQKNLKVLIAQSGELAEDVYALTVGVAAGMRVDLERVAGLKGSAVAVLKALKPFETGSTK